MADDIAQKITALPEITALVADTLLAVVEDPDGPGKKTKKSPASKVNINFLITAAEIAAGITPTNLLFKPGNIRRYGVDNTGATDDTTLVQDTLINLAAQGVVDFYWPAGSYLQRDVFLPDDVEVYGDGDATIISAPTGANPFRNNGIHPNNVEDYTYNSLNDITADDIVLTLDTAADTSRYVVDGLAFLRSTAEDVIPAGPNNDNRSPHFIEIVKIKAIDVGTGTLTLEYAIKDAVTDPKITPPLTTNHVLGPPFIPDAWCQNTTLRDMKLVSVDGSGWSMITGYKCVMRNIRIDAKHIFINNAMTHCLFENIRGEFTTGRGIETKMGSYNTTFRDFDIRSASTTFAEPIISTGEYSRDIIFDDFNIYCPNSDFTSVDGIIHFDAEAGRRHRVRNGKIIIGDAYAVVKIVHGNDPDNQDITVENITVKAKSIARPIALINGTGIRGSRFTIRNIDTLDSPITNNVNGDSVAGYFLDQDNQDLTITDCRINGSIALDGTKTTPGMVFTNNRYTDFTGTDAIASQVLSEIYFKDNHRIGADKIYSSQIRVSAAVNITSTTPNNVVNTWTIPASQTWLAGDLLRFEIIGQIAGTNDAKFVDIADNTGSLIAVTWLAAETGGFILTGLLNVNTNTVYRTAFQAAAETPKLTQNTVTRSGLDLNTNGRAFTLQAWVTNASDTIEISSVKMWPDLLGT